MRLGGSESERQSEYLVCAEVPVLVARKCESGNGALFVQYLYACESWVVNELEALDDRRRKRCKQ